MEGHKRLAYVDIAKGIGILMVLLGHLLENGSPIKSMIYSFHMPLFFMLSGTVMKNESFRVQISKRFYGIWIPYVLWGFLFAGFSFSKAVYILYGTNETLIQAGSNGMLWFLSATFLASVIGGRVLSIGSRVKKRGRYLILSAGLLAAMSLVLSLLHNNIQFRGEAIGLPFALDVSILAAAFVVAGKFLAETFFQKTRMLKGYQQILLACIFAGASVAGIYEKNRNGYPQMATYDIGNPVFYFVVAVVAGTGVILLAQWIGLHAKGWQEWPVRYLSWLGTNSMLVFILHRTALYSFKKVCGDNGIGVFILAWAALLVYSSVLAFTIGRVCPFLAGRYRPQGQQEFR